MDEPDLRVVDESARVLAWRLETALELGVPVEAAELFAASSGDLHKLEELIRGGCDPRLAARILT